MRLTFGADPYAYESEESPDTQRKMQKLTALVGIYNP